MEEREEKWEFCHEENLLWTAGITKIIAQIMNEQWREVQIEF
jgi:hypothetical protein